MIRMPVRDKGQAPGNAGIEPEVGFGEPYAGGRNLDRTGGEEIELAVTGLGRVKYQIVGQ
jgi:hypothetical protein